jgi:hypothetical protein
MRAGQKTQSRLGARLRGSDFTQVTYFAALLERRFTAATLTRQKSAQAG